MSLVRFTYVSDNHGDKVNPLAKAACLSFVRDFKPDIRIHGGDNWDLRPMRRGAHEDEKQESLVADFQAGIEFVQEYQPTVFLRGNHDERLWDLAKYGRGIERDFASRGIGELTQLFEQLNCPVVPYNKRNGVFRLGDLSAIHGYKYGIGAVRPQANAYGRGRGIVLMGHGHGIWHCPVEGAENLCGWMCGCLCDLEMDYNRANFGSLNQRNGFAYGVIDSKSGRVEAFQAASGADGSWMFLNDIWREIA